MGAAAWRHAEVECWEAFTELKQEMSVRERAKGGDGEGGGR